MDVESFALVPGRRLARSLGFRTKVVDMFHWGRPRAEHFQDDICMLVRLLYDAVGGQRHYAKQPTAIKSICCGLKRSLITKKFCSITRLRAYVESMEWE